MYQPIKANAIQCNSFYALMLGCPQNYSTLLWRRSKWNCTRPSARTCSWQKVGDHKLFSICSIRWWWFWSRYDQALYEAKIKHSIFLITFEIIIPFGNVLIEKTLAFYHAQRLKSNRISFHKFFYIPQKKFTLWPNRNLFMGHPSEYEASTNG